MKSEGGILLINKPRDWTSYDVIRFLKGKFGFKKIGHAGTLDPAATGLLIVLIGSATKSFDKIQQLPKTYLATIKFGITTDTYDLDGIVTSQTKIPFQINKKQLEQVVKKYTGVIRQTPPRYSAIKIKGVRAYQLARKNKNFKMKPRTATIYKATIKKFSKNIVQIEWMVSSGTYIRSLAHDIGKALVVGGVLSALKRTAIGPYKISAAKKPSLIKSVALKAPQ